MKKMFKDKQTVHHAMLLGTVLLGIAFVLVTASVLHNRKEAEMLAHKQQEESIHNELKERNARLLSEVFGNLNLEADSVYVWDMNARQSIYAKNENEVLPLASLTKIMTALVAKKHLPADHEVVIGYDSYFTEGNNGLVPQERWSVSDLIDFTLVVSSNDGAEALAAAYGSLTKSTPQAFVEKMNNEARTLGLLNLNFRNPTGLDNEQSRSAEAFGTAKDTTLLLDYVMRTYPEVMEATTEDSIELYSKSNIYHRAPNTNKLVDEIPFLIGSKTGYTDLAGGNLSVVFDVGLMHPVIITVLSSSREGRFNDVEKLQRAVSDYFAHKQVTSEAPNSSPQMPEKSAGRQANS